MEANPPQAARLQSRRRHYATASDPNPRLSIQFQPRLGMSLIVSSIAGSLLGVTHGMRSARLRFQAENAHRLPTTPTGWYLYHKSKNYISMLGGIKEGSKMGFKVAVGVGIYVMCEEGIDRLRGRRDAGSSVVAGGAVAGGWCLWNRFPLPTAARTAKSGLLFGLCFGLAQDMLSVAKGNSVGYVDFTKRILGV